MRILVTGTSGQVGGALLPLLEGQGSVLGPKRDAFDLSRPETLGETLDALRPDLIVNPAAYTAVDRAEDERELAFRVNAEAPAAMAKWAARHGVPMIHVSTDYVFDGSGTAPWREDSAPNPLSVYGASKLAGDQAIIAAAPAHLIVRTSWVYAAKGANFLNTIIRLAREREELRVVADQVGAPTPARVIAETVASVLGAAQGDPARMLGERGGILNVACSGETSWHGFATAIVDGMRARGVELKCERITPILTAEFPTKAKRPANSRLRLARLEEAFGIDVVFWAAALDRECERLVGNV
ncbi:dTDP-4-dehydrorhamnose reductase [Bradyrhizobium sp. AS23.2]|uniref:dTDP-4-dehydrorhamnose reductase n=1 Tax=Bradyrhizobium sp. AS23.2 TaxID=1680155 RepID=UPI000939A2CA|nr:dTDP-4-dehydrorhamnose reductase [Bradyrhizobium sp. AS23.2]OKO73841.1 dTDP-4-dehydrorhamnose reductase [Bradyrhizobium sp. AS23.2]